MLHVVKINKEIGSCMRNPYAVDCLLIGGRWFFFKMFAAGAVAWRMTEKLLNSWTGEGLAGGLSPHDYRCAAHFCGVPYFSKLWVEKGHNTLPLAIIICKHTHTEVHHQLFYWSCVMFRFHMPTFL
jgi:hypothetical protein